ncbi:(deoxy)nucleoside triphosphate pyrophosphohydrolase [Nocardioides sp. YIM 152588]|uniref:(deoxy)nucleoside triphosphate pyrophosphohydrolase n=1 Tax=Nocardioides sp. YIM 152588 TaxID=3158259 RepID=UPI0032E4FFE9
MTTPLPRLVVGAVIVDDLGAPSRVLGCRRTGPEALAGLWEFPGGKVEDGETPELALARELREELALEVTVGDELPGPSGRWPIDERYELALFLAAITGGTPAAGPDHDEVRWLGPTDLGSVPWLPSDLQAIGPIRALLAAPGT